MPSRGRSAPSPPARAASAHRRPAPAPPDRQERVQPFGVAVDACQAGLRQLARADLAATQHRADLGDRAIGEREGVDGHRQRPLLQDHGHAEHRLLHARRVPEGRLARHGRPRHVVTHHVLERDHLGRRPHAAGVDRLQLPDRLQDAVQLALHQVDLLVGETQPGQRGNVLDVLATDHGPMLAGDNAPHGRGTRHGGDPDPRRTHRGVPAARPGDRHRHAAAGAGRRGDRPATAGGDRAGAHAPMGRPRHRAAGGGDWDGRCRTIHRRSST